MAGTPYVHRLEAAFGADPTAAPASWTWTDITADVFGGVDVEVQHGRSPGASQSEPCRISFVLKNRDEVSRVQGTYTPDNVSSSRWPNIRLGLPIRFSNKVSGSFVVQAVALATSIEPDYDEPNFPTVKFTAEGLLRRLRQGDRPLRSPLYRSLSGPMVPKGYWPMEDPSGSSSFAEAFGGKPCVWTHTAPTFASSGPPGSLPLPKLESPTQLDAVLTRYPASSSWTFSFIVNIPATPGTDEVVIEWRSAGARVVWRVGIFLGSPDTIALQAWDATGAGGNLGTMTFQAGTFVEPYGEHIQINATANQNGGNIDWSLHVNHPTAGSTSISGSFAGTVGNISAWSVPNSFSHPAYVYGHVAIYSSVVSPVIGALSGFTGETADNRITRICSEENVQLALTGSSTELMGPQPVGSFTTILAECEAADGGILRDAKAGGLAYVCRSGLYNQAAAVVLDHDQLQTFVRLRSQLDDLGHVNDVTVSRSGGSSARVVDAADIAASDEYPETKTVNVSSDARLPYQAGWRVSLGTPGVMRWPVVPIDLYARPELVSQWTACDLGSRITLRNMPDQANDVDLIVVGYRQMFNAFKWYAEVNCESYVPWQIHVVNTDRVDASASTLSTAATAAATTLSVFTSLGPRWTTTGYPLDMNVDGEQIHATAMATVYSDGFGRTVSSGLGSADTGQGYNFSGGTNSDYNVSTGLGRITHPSANVTHYGYCDVSTTDFDLAYTFTCPVTPTGSNIAVRVLGRLTDTSNWYGGQLDWLTDGTMQVRFVKSVAGTVTVIGSTVNIGVYGPGDFVRVRSQGLGTALSMKAWAQNLTAEPPDWQSTATDSSLTTGNNVGFATVRFTSNTDTSVVVTVDDGLLISPQTATVTRALNGVSKAHSAGAAVTLWRPGRIGL